LSIQLSLQNQKLSPELRACALSFGDGYQIGDQVGPTELALAGGQVVVGGVAIAHHHAGKASPFSGLDQLHGKPHLLACGGKAPVHGGERTSQALASGPSCIGCALVKWNSSCRSKASAGLAGSSTILAMAAADGDKAAPRKVIEVAKA
jgi:hypothetical protein